MRKNHFLWYIFLFFFGQIKNSYSLHSQYNAGNIKTGVMIFVTI